MIIREFEQQTKEDADKSAREIIALAIQRCAADHVSEAAISVVPLPKRRDEGPHHRPGGPEHPGH